MRRVLADLIPDNEEAKRTTRTENIRAEILALTETGIGTAIPGVRGTAWGLYNAVTEYVDHERSTERDNAGARFLGSGTEAPGASPRRRCQPPRQSSNNRHLATAGAEPEQQP